jgi:hypothetical protein
MAQIKILDALRKVYGVRGLPFPATPQDNVILPVGQDFEGVLQTGTASQRSKKGTALWGINILGRPVFLPVKFDGIDIPNPLVIISGEKEIVETDVVDVGTVFEKVFIKPYNITIISTLIGDYGDWPEDAIIQMEKIWREKDIVTMECALTDIFIQPKNNFLIDKIDLLTTAGEGVEVIQWTGRSNKDFELEIK